jgi:hypothetical protein
MAVSRNSPNSVIQQWNLQIERQLAQRTVLNVAYVGAKSDHLSTFYNYNIYQFNTAAQNFPNLGSITWQSYSGTANYNGLQMKLDHRYNHGLTMTGAYTWSHSLDNSPGAFQGETIMLWYNPQANYGSSNIDHRHTFSSSILYELPFGRGKTFGKDLSRPLDMVVGGWQMNLIAALSSGGPFDLSVNGTPTNRPDQIAPVSYKKSVQGTWFDTSAFSGNIPRVSANGQSVFTRIGNTRRNVIYGPSTRTVDVSLSKQVPLTDRFKLDLHADAFNALNTAQFVNPSGNINDANFGKLTSIRRSSNRQLQLAVHLNF